VSSLSKGCSRKERAGGEKLGKRQSVPIRQGGIEKARKGQAFLREESEGGWRYECAAIDEGEKAASAAVVKKPRGTISVMHEIRN